jgi:hypothetical protein
VCGVEDADVLPTAFRNAGFVTSERASALPRDRTYTFPLASIFVSIAGLWPSGRVVVD